MVLGIGYIPGVLDGSIPSAHDEGININKIENE